VALRRSGEADCADTTESDSVTQSIEMKKTLTLSSKAGGGWGGGGGGRKKKERTD